MHKVDFGFQLHGAIDGVLVYANGVPVHRVKINNATVGGFKGALIKDDSVLQVDFHIMGLNGTDYRIEYSFSDNGAAESDPGNPSPIAGTINSNGKVLKSIKFQC